MQQNIPNFEEEKVQSPNFLNNKKYLHKKSLFSSKKAKKSN